MRQMTRLVSRMFGCSIALTAVGLLPLAAASAVLMAPEPDAIPRRWQLDVKAGELRLAQFPQADGSVKSYFYLTYRVTNHTGEDILFAPGFELANGEGEVIRSGRGVSIEAANTIQQNLQNAYLEDQISVLGMLLQGDENAKEGIVIWPANQLHLSEVTVYAAGFSGEVKIQPAKDPKTGESVAYPLYKSMMIRYKLPGDLDSHGSEPFAPDETKWIMR